MREVENLIVGWLDGSIGTTVAAGLLSQFKRVLVTSIDSITALSDGRLADRIKRLDPECFIFGAGILVRGSKLIQIAESLDLFNGFDEVWCFDHTPASPKPNDLWIVSPLNIETDSIPVCLVPWMAETNCRLALGDGFGLNLATPQQEIASQIARLIR